MKILNVNKEQVPTISYSVEIEIEKIVYIYQFESWDWDLTEEQILERYKQNLDGDYVGRKQ